MPFDHRKPFVTSGLRVGTPAVTSRGMAEAEMKTIARLIAKALDSVDNDVALASVAEEVEALCRRFPIYPARGYLAA